MQFRHVKSDIDILTANATERHSAPPTLSSYRITGESQGGTESRIGSKGGRDDISATAHSDSESYAIACGTDLMHANLHTWYCTRMLAYVGIQTVFCT